jgi:hypothetical protein
MKIFINIELKNENQLEELVKSCIEKIFQNLNIQVDFLHLNFDYQYVKFRSNLDEIEIIKSFSNKNFIYASYFDLNSIKAPTVIDKNSFDELKQKLNEDEAKFIEDCYVNENEQFLLKVKIPELKFNIDQSLINNLFNIIKNDGFETYIERNMKNYFILNKNLKFQNHILRLVFASKEIKIDNKIDNKIEVSHFPQTSIEAFLENFQIDLREILNKSDEFKKLSLDKDEKNIKFHHEKFCEEKLKIFVGRDEQLHYIIDRIKDPTVSYIIIYGESGSGKTR